jgi:hypothetical protein
MLDKLPLETLTQILRYNLPSFSRHDYRQRQNILLNLCRTCKALLHAAQPLLFEVVELRPDSSLESFLKLAEDKAKGERVKVMRIDVPATEPVRSMEAIVVQQARLVSCCPSLVEFRLQHSLLDLCVLEALPSESLPLSLRFKTYRLSLRRPPPTCLR